MGKADLLLNQQTGLDVGLSSGVMCLKACLGSGLLFFPAVLGEPNQGIAVPAAFHLTAPLLLCWG